MIVLLGLLGALAYGISDFAGGVASRSRNSFTVLLWAYPVGAILCAALLPLSLGELTWRVVLCGIGGGLSGLTAVSIFYRLMAAGPMNVISPITGVLAAIVPVVLGLVIGERPSALAWLGILLGLLAVLFVSRTGADHPHARVPVRTTLLAAVAGIGFGLYFVFLNRAGDDSGLWPLLVARLTSSVLIVPVALRVRAFATLPPRILWIALLTGVCDASANLFFLLASREGLVSIAGVLTALYPAVTVLLAIGFLHERVSRPQVAGLALAVGSIVLVTV